MMNAEYLISKLEEFLTSNHISDEFAAQVRDLILHQFNQIVLEDSKLEEIKTNIDNFKATQSDVPDSLLALLSALRGLI